MDFTYDETVRVITRILIPRHLWEDPFFDKSQMSIDAEVQSFEEFVECETIDEHDLEYVLERTQSKSLVIEE